MAAEPVIYDDDAPKLSDEELAEFRPAREVMSETEYRAATAVRKGRPRSAKPKTSITLRLDPEVVEALRGTGKGWHTRAGAVLAQSVGITVALDGTVMKRAEGRKAQEPGGLKRSPRRGTAIKPGKGSRVA